MSEHLVGGKFWAIEWLMFISRLILFIYCSDTEIL
jgi:hypothetical protein